MKCEIFDVSPSTYGLIIVTTTEDGTVDSRVDIIVQKNDKVPCTHVRTYSISRNGTAKLCFKVIRSNTINERDLLDLANVVTEQDTPNGMVCCELVMSIPNAIPHDIDISVEFGLEIDGVVMLRATEPIYGVTEEVLYKPSTDNVHGILENEIDQTALILATLGKNLEKALEDENTVWLSDAEEALDDYQKGDNPMVYGIDLGTTYSRISRLSSNGQPVVIEDMWTGLESMASAVFIHENGRIDVGESAKEEGFCEPDRLLQYFKRWIGRSNDPNRERYIVDNKEYDPVELCTIVLSKIISYAKDSGEDVKDVVVTYPAWFDMNQIVAMRDACVAAGLNVRAMINESAAASINYCAKHTNGDQNIIVYDLGGSKFDVSLLKMTKNSESQGVEILCMDGDAFLGGCDWDNELYQLLLSKYEEQYGVSADLLPEDLQSCIREGVESLKMKLTHKETAKFKIPYDGENVILEVTRREFESATAGYVEQTIGWLNSVLNRANMADDDIGVVLLVGGSTRMPMIRNMLTKRFGEKVFYDDPEKAIAKGAAIIAGNIDVYQSTLMTKADSKFKLTTAEDKLKEHLQDGKARLVYDPEIDKVRIRYDSEIPENPIIDRIVDDVRRCLNDLYESHIRIDRIRRNTKGAFFDSKRAEDMRSELDSLIRNQKKIDQLFRDIDCWNVIESKAK